MSSLYLYIICIWLLGDLTLRNELELVIFASLNYANPYFRVFFQTFFGNYNLSENVNNIFEDNSPKVTLRTNIKF